MTIEEAWYLFETHARACETCTGPLRQLLALLGSDAVPPSSAVSEVILGCCDDGQARAAAWDHLCALALGRQEPTEDDPPMLEVSSLGPLLPHILRRRQELVIEGPEAEVRATLEALAQLSGEAFLHVLQLPPERRQAAIEAITATYVRTGGVRAQEPVAPGPARRTCRRCGTRVRNQNHELCNDCWRAEDKAQRQRRTLFPDDD